MVFEIVRAEGTAPELVREGRKEKRGGRKRTVACEKEKEGGSSRQQDWTTAQTLQSFFCFSEGTDFLFSLLRLLSLLGHDPSGHLDLRVHLEKMIDTL